MVAANQLVAASLPKAAVPHSSGLTLYATLITSATEDPRNTLAPFVIPAVPNYPALPTPMPTPADANPVSYPATVTASASAQDAAIRAYNAQMASLTAQVQTVRAQVTTDAKRLTSWNPATDDGPTDVWGCLQLARQRFSGQQGEKALIIASNMQNATDVNFTSDFESSKALQGVRVHVIYYYCQDAPQCQSRQAQWTRVFTGAGAAAVQFDDPAQSQMLTNLFAAA
jgi:hypothetical protein